MHPFRRLQPLLVFATVGLMVLSCKDKNNSREDADPNEEEEQEADAAVASEGGKGGTGAKDAAVAVDSRPADARAPDTAGPAAYDPCPAKGTPCRVMPLGDSITDGFYGGYRIPLFSLAVKAGRNLTFVGSLENGPETVEERPFPRAHEGHSGYTIDPGDRSGISPLIPSAITAAKPHIVLLMIGTNDVDTQDDLKNAPARLGALMDKILAADARLQLVVAQIVPTRDDEENALVRAYNGAIPALVKARADAGKHVAMVDMYTAFTANAAYKTTYLADALHPTETGYDRMAQVWYKAISGWLK